MKLGVKQKRNICEQQQTKEMREPTRTHKTTRVRAHLKGGRSSLRLLHSLSHGLKYLLQLARSLSLSLHIQKSLIALILCLVSSRLYSTTLYSHSTLNCLSSTEFKCRHFLLAFSYRFLFLIRKETHF